MLFRLFKLLIFSIQERFFSFLFPGKSYPLRTIPVSLQPAGIRSTSTEEGGGGGLCALEWEESSIDLPAKEDRHCSICMEDKYSFECFAMRGCAHAFCVPCVAKYVAAKVEANEAWVRCPDPDCAGAGRVEPDMCGLILPAATLERWGDRLCEEGIPPQTRFYCPHKGCGVLLVLLEEDEVAKVACPHCKRQVCGSCRVPWHRRVTCKEFQELADQRERKVVAQLLELATKRKWQRCPGCGIIIEKKNGCNYMTCRCLTEFCYKCSSPLSKERRICGRCAERD